MRYTNRSLNEPLAGILSTLGLVLCGCHAADATPKPSDDGATFPVSDSGSGATSGSGGATSTGTGTAAGGASDLPLFQPADLVHVGTLSLPVGIVEERGLAYRAATNSLFIGQGFLNDANVGEVSIPTTGTAELLQPFADPTEGRVFAVEPTDCAGGYHPGGLLATEQRLIETVYCYYDAEGQQVQSHFTHALDLSAPSVQGPFALIGPPQAGFVSGWMAWIPEEWRDALGGPALVGQGSISIISRTSWGPGAFSFDPEKLDSDPTATALFYYDSEHPTLGTGDGDPTSWTQADTIGGMAIVPGTRSLLYFGRHGTGANPYTPGFCYGPGTDDTTLAGTPVPGTDYLYCYDPVSGDQGGHAYPYEIIVWAYDLNDLAAVKAGAKQPWEVVPYTTWDMAELDAGGVAPGIGGVAIDPATKTIYLSQQWVGGDGNSAIQKYRVP